MNAFVALTDDKCFNFLASLPQLEEINFWQPGGQQAFTTPLLPQRMWRLND
jgi:hypothetical protein